MLSENTITHNNKLQSAIVIGGGMAGLVAARVLSDHFAQVTIIERDKLPQGGEARSGVPQGRHPHAVLKRGLETLEILFPGIKDEVIEAGALNFNMGRGKWFAAGTWRPRFESSVESVVCSRPLLEYVVRSRLLKELAGRVRILEEMEVTGLVTDAAISRAMGVSLRKRVGEGQQSENVEVLQADLIVDASGRNSHAPQWLDKLGLMPPLETVIDAFPGYASRIFKRKADQDWKTMYVQPSAPDNKRGAVCFAMENNQVQVTLIGINKDYPPTDEAGFIEFARSLPIPDVYDLITTSEPTSQIVGYRRAENRLNHYDKLPQYLENFLVTGDAVFSFNPVYGQGMTISILCDVELGACLSERQGDLVGLAAEYQKRIMPIVMGAWQMAVGEDLYWPETAGDLPPMPEPEMMLLGNYLAQVMKAAAKNKHVLEAFYRVMHMMSAPTSLLQPDVVLQVVAEMSGMSNPATAMIEQPQVVAQG